MSKFLTFEEKTIFKAFTESQFEYCPLMAVS